MELHPCMIRVRLRASKLSMKRIFVSLLLIPAVFFSCSKHNDSRPGRCRIVGVIDSIYGANGAFFTNTANLSYDNDGRLSLYATISPTDTFSRVWTYGPGYTIVYPGSSPATTDTVLFADSNRVRRVVEYEQGYGTDYYDYTYNAAGELQTETRSTSDPNYPPYTITYTWSGGDVTSTKDGAGYVTTYSYYPDKLSADGDPFTFRDFLLLGAAKYRNKHLVKSVVSGGGVANYSYEFDRSGKIISYSASSGAYFGKTSYIYDCAY